MSEMDEARWIILIRIADVESAVENSNLYPLAKDMLRQIVEDWKKFMAIKKIVEGKDYGNT